MAKASVDEELEGGAGGLTAFQSKLVNILALFLVKDRKQTEQIGLLRGAGFRPAQIAALLGTTPNTVRVELSNQKSAKKRKKPKKAK